MDLGEAGACAGTLLIPGGGDGAVVFKPLGCNPGVCTLGFCCLISLMRSCCRFKDSPRNCWSLFCQSENCWAWGWGWVLAGWAAGAGFLGAVAGSTRVGGGTGCTLPGFTGSTPGLFFSPV